MQSFPYSTPESTNAMEMKRRLCLTLVLGGLMTVAGVGCGGADDTLPREAVSGTVSFEGAPLAQGTIQFMPTAQGADGSATVGSGIITDGKYSIAQEQGLVPGTYKVIVSSAPPGPPVTDEAPGIVPPTPRDLIPAKYNAASTLTAEVKAGTDNTFDFDLRK
jgi:hypothetical protein